MEGQRVKEVIRGADQAQIWIYARARAFWVYFWYGNEPREVTETRRNVVSVRRRYAGIWNATPEDRTYRIRIGYDFHRRSATSAI
ncbi:coenzyme A synthetase [Aspergillus luchuensis]|nr:coenzyme A synthetase [Aspergillus luchuensis]